MLVNTLLLLLASIIPAQAHPYQVSTSEAVDAVPHIVHEPYVVRDDHPMWARASETPITPLVPAVSWLVDTSDKKHLKPSMNGSVYHTANGDACKPLLLGPR